MISTGIYVRVSTEEQAREGYSIRAQEEKLRAYAVAKDWKIFSVYADEGISGKDIDGRPAVRQLIADVTSGKIKNVLVYKIDRLTRSTKNLIELVELFNQHDCAFNSLNESIDTTSATGRMFLKIVGIFAEFERENLAERVRLGLERKVKEGYALCNFRISYGYNRENGNRVQEIVDDEAAIVRRIFQMYLYDDYSFTKIVKTLNAENILTKSGTKWIPGTIKWILTNPTHIGKVRYSMKDKTRYFENDGHHEPIIEESIFYQVQDKISKMKKVTRTKRPSCDVYFCGVLSCNSCGGKYSTKWAYKDDVDGNRTIKYPNYRCTNSIKDRCADKSSVSHTKVEQAFEDFILGYDDFVKFDNVEADKDVCDNSGEITTISAEIWQIEKKTEEVMDLFITNAIDFNTYQGMVKLSNQRRGELESRLNQLQNAEESKESRYSVMEIVSNIQENWNALDNEQRLQFIQKFVKKILMHSIPQDNGRHREVIIDDIQFNDF